MIMLLTDMTITDFSNLLGSDAPAPGGGSTAALSGALGAALTAMVAALTFTKKKYARDHELAHEIFDQATALKEDLLKAIDEDTEAFNMVSAAFSLPKATDEEKKVRSEAIQDGLTACTESPLAIMKLSLEAIRLATKLNGHFNSSAASDLGVSALSIRTGLLGAWLNVLINIGSLKDVEKAAKYKAEGEAILAEALPMADELYKAIEESLM